MLERRSRSPHPHRPHTQSPVRFPPRHSVPRPYPHTPTPPPPLFEDWSEGAEDELDAECSGWRDYDPDVTRHDSATCDCSFCEANRDVEGGNLPEGTEETALFSVYQELIPVLRRLLSEDQFSVVEDSDRVWGSPSPSRPLYWILGGIPSRTSIGTRSRRTRIPPKF